MRWQTNKLDHMQTICTSHQTHNHTSTSTLNFLEATMLFLTSNSFRALKATINSTKLSAVAFVAIY